MVMILWQSSKVSSEWIDKRAAFDFVINTVHASAVQISKFICVALGFCVFLTSSLILFTPRQCK